MWNSWKNRFWIKAKEMREKPQKPPPNIHIHARIQVWCRMESRLSKQSTKQCKPKQKETTSTYKMKMKENRWIENKLRGMQCKRSVTVATEAAAAVVASSSSHQILTHSNDMMKRKRKRTRGEMNGLCASVLSSEWEKSAKKRPQTMKLNWNERKISRRELANWGGCVCVHRWEKSDRWM